MCDTTKQYKMSYDVKLGMENGKQIIEEATFNSDVDMDNNIIVSLVFYNIFLTDILKSIIEKPHILFLRLLQKFRWSKMENGDQY